jgi:hypothetical protein
MTTPIIISLPTEDRARAHAFYRDGLGFEPIGELADDGLPEPLTFVVNAGLHLMLVPTGGFGWVLGDGDVAPAGTHEVVLSVSAEGPADVDALLERAQLHGGRIATPPAEQPWGYTGTVADPDGHLWMVEAPPGPSPAP